MNNAVNLYYEGFEHPGNNLSKYLQTSDLFSIMLKDGKIIHFTPDDRSNFLTWLKSHHVIDIRGQN